MQEENQTVPKNKRLLLLISLGAILEYYDFAIFIYLAPLIGKSLIPVANPTVNLILSYAIFAIGAIVRPLGGVIFSHIGDTGGRSKTFIYTIVLMAIPTFLIAFIPSVGIIGIWATILLLFFRVLQGFAISGEIPGSIVFGYEISRQQYKARNTAIVVMGTNIGFTLASIVCAFLIKTHWTMFSSWRLAFIFGGIFGIISYFLRKKISETPEFTQYKKVIEKETIPLKILVTKYHKPVWQLLGIGGFLASVLAVFTFYMPIYLANFYHLPLDKLMEFNSYTIIIFILGSLIAGFFDQYFGKKFFLWFIPIFLLLAMVLFHLYPYLTIEQIFCIHVFMLLVIGIVNGRFPVLCATFFPVAVRYSGVALVYNISFGIIAGSTQMLLTWLIKLTGILWLPAIYIGIFGVLAFIALLSVRREQLVNYQ